MKRVFTDPGALSHRMVLEVMEETQDECGGAQIVWRSLGYVWAKLVPRRPRTGPEAQQNVERIEHDITVRFRHDLNSQCRFRMGTRVFEIMHVHDPDERRRYFICRCEEVGR